VAIVRDDDQGVEPDPPYPSARLPCDVSTGIRGWPIHYPDLDTVVVVGYHPT
jgi:hypothetical protein